MNRIDQPGPLIDKCANHVARAALPDRSCCTHSMSVFKDLIRRLRQGAKRKAKEQKERARAQARRLRFESESWQRNQFLARRQYDSYDDYLRHQTEKLAHVRHRLDETYADDLAEFKRRFSTCEALRETRS